MDLYIQFIKDCVVEVYINEVRNNTVYVSVSEMYVEFKLWFKTFYPGKNIPIRQDLRNVLYYYWGAPVSNRGWSGIRISSQLTPNMLK